MKIILYMAMTINGMIAKENDETPWGQEVWDSYYKIAKKLNVIILGRKTFEIMKEVNEFEKIGNPFTVVLTSKKMPVEKNTVFVSSPKEAIQILRDKKFSEVLLAGGGNANGAFMKEGLIDELYLDIEPQIFGKGIPLFGSHTFEARLQLVEAKAISKNVIQLHYTVKKPK